MSSFLKSVARQLADGLLSGRSNAVILSGDGASFTLPVVPETFDVSVSSKNGTVYINNAGEYNMIGETGLKSVTIASFFPGQSYSFCVTRPQAPSYYVSTIEAWRTGKVVVRIAVTAAGIDIPCLIELFSYGAHDGSTDIFFSVSLREYRYVAERANILDDVTQLAARPDGFLSKTAANTTMFPGENPLTAVARAAGQTLGGQGGYLDAYEVIMKRGGLSAGDVLDLTGGIKINGTRI